MGDGYRCRFAVIKKPFPVSLTHDKGHYRQHPKLRCLKLSNAVDCDRNPESVIHCILELLFAPDVPLGRLH
jgi:hypothetical protein